MDVASFVGMTSALIALVGGQLALGGSIGPLLQFSALLIVIAGTAAATLLAFPITEATRAFALLPAVFSSQGGNLRPTVEEIVRIANVARKDGLLAIENHRSSVRHLSFRRALKFVTDGFEPAVVREILDAEISQGTREEEGAADVLEHAARSAVAAGVLGTSLALMRVPAATNGAWGSAFCALAYGLWIGVLILLPIAKKLRSRAKRKRAERELIRQGVIGILEGQNPTLLQEQLQSLARSIS